MVIDWSIVLGQVLQSVLVAFATLVLPALLVLIVGKAGQAWKQFKAEQPGWAAAIQRAAYVGVYAAEQLRKSGVLPTGAEAKDYAVSYVQQYLERSGIRGVDVALIADTVEAAVYEMPAFDTGGEAKTGYALPSD